LTTNEMPDNNAAPAGHVDLRPAFRVTPLSHSDFVQVPVCQSTRNCRQFAPRIRGNVRFAQTLACVQHRALTAIEACRTLALGGHRETCDHCGASRAGYHSCRNRHCPKCQHLSKQRWIEVRRAELLPVPGLFISSASSAREPVAESSESAPRVVRELAVRRASRNQLTSRIVRLLLLDRIFLLLAFGRVSGGLSRG
jgi:hypothetical protein